MTKTRKLLAAVAAAVAIGVAGVTVGTSPAEAGHKKHFYKHHHFYKFYNPYVYSYYGHGYYGNCYVKWTKYGKSYVCF